MVGAAVEAAGLKAELDAVLSVDTVKMFKPSPEVYALVTKEFSCAPAEVTFISSNRWDAMGATAFGFRTVWINRGNAPDEYPDFPPVAVVTNLTGLLSVKV
jgi:2-haloacid dehalogenase